MSYGDVCAYCGVLRGVNKDHVVPRQLVRAYNRRTLIVQPPIPAEWRATVWSCFACNLRKGARRLVPASWADRVDALNDFFGPPPFRVWDGDPKSVAFAGVWGKGIK